MTMRKPQQKRPTKKKRHYDPSKEAIAAAKRLRDTGVRYDWLHSTRLYSGWTTDFNVCVDEIIALDALNNSPPRAK